MDTDSVQANISGDESSEIKLSQPAEESIEVVNKSSDDHAHDLLSSLKKLQFDGDFCDVTITCGDFQMTAHRHVLASATEYFKGMFLNETKEAENRIVDFSAMSPKVVKQCIEFIYSGKVDISMQIARELLDASEMLQLPKLSKLCVEFLGENVDMKSCAEVISLFNLYNEGSLDESLMDFLDENFEEFSESDDFLSMNYQDLIYCLKLLEDNKAECQEKMWNSILSWTKANLHQRKSHFPHLFKMLNLECLAESSVRNEIYEEELVDDSVECLRLVRDVLLTSVETTNSLMWDLEDSSPVMSITKDSGIIVAGSVQNSSVAKFPSKITVDMDVIFHNGKIYVGTGLKIYEFANEEWTFKDVDFTRVRKVAPCITCPSCYRDHFYVGDSHRFEKKNDVMWSSVPVEGALMALHYYQNCHGCSTPMKKLKCNESSYNRCIGVGSSVFMLTRNYVIEYSTSSSHITHHDISIGLGNGFFIISYEDIICCLGGNGTERKAVICRPHVFGVTVSHLPDMPTPKSFGCAFLMNEKLFATGKDSGQPVEFYDFSTKRWHQAEYKMIPQANSTQFGNNLRGLIQTKYLKNG